MYGIASAPKAALVTAFTTSGVAIGAGIGAVLGCLAGSKPGKAFTWKRGYKQAVIGGAAGALAALVAARVTQPRA